MTLGLYRERDATKAAAKAFVLHSACFDVGWSAESFSRLLENPNSTIFFVRELEADIGFVLLQHVGEEAEILTLGISPSYRREGIGSALLWFAEKALAKEGVTRFFLEVSESNIAALNLYNRLEYIEFSRRPRYYADGTDAICLQKTLT